VICNKSINQLVLYAVELVLYSEGSIVCGRVSIVW